MIYKKPKGVKYTDMAIYIDNHIRNAEATTEELEQCYKYICLIIEMLTHKAKYFKTASNYDDFAVWFGSHVYMRMVNPKLDPVKSSLNYIKASCYPMKVAFEKEFYAQTISYPEEETDYDTSHYDFVGMLHSNDELISVEFESCLNDIPRVIKKFLTKLPYDKHSSEWQNIYLSCLLTFLNSITISNKDLKRLSAGYSSNIERNIIDSVFEKEGLDCVILYNLPSCMKDYIGVLHNEIKHIVAKDLGQSLQTYIPPAENLRSLMFAELNTEDIWEDNT